MEQINYSTVYVLRRIKTYRSNVIYSAITTGGFHSEWYLDANDTSTANNYSDCIVNAAGQRLKRVRPKIRVVNNVDVTVLEDDSTIIVKGNTTTKTVTLPAAATNTNRIITIKSSGTHDLTTSIAMRKDDSSTTTTIDKGHTAIIQSDGTEWWIFLLHKVI
jgi:hypothetical protein